MLRRLHISDEPRKAIHLVYLRETCRILVIIIHQPTVLLSVAIVP
jgi:hypothetical protein